MKFLDFDNDGWKDIFVGNGHVNPQVDQHSFGVTYAQRPLLFHNLRDSKFAEIGMRSGEALNRHYVARGAASADFWNSEHQDMLISVLDGSPVLLRNTSTQSGHWLRIKLVGSKSNRDGFGAQVEVKTGDLTQRSEARANSSFESASDPRLHFGLGVASKVDSISVRWPSGRVETIGSEMGDQELVIAEGQGVVARHPGVPHPADK
jgi:enediyne biosynthesis protein E4